MGKQLCDCAQDKQKRKMRAADKPDVDLNLIGSQLPKNKGNSS